MPALGAGMESGRVLEWHVRAGDVVHRGEIIALVETDKANIEVEVFEDGVVEELLVPEGAKVPVGTVLARLTSTPEARTAAPQAPDRAPAPLPPPTATSEPAAVVSDVAVHSRVVSPLVRRLAGQRGIDVTHLAGTGPGGVVTRHDVEAAATDRATSVRTVLAAPEAPRTVRAAGRASPYARRLAAEHGLDPAALTGSGPDGAVVARDVLAAKVTPASVEGSAEAMRQAIARAMERSNREIPHYHLGETVDVDATLAWLEESNAQRPANARLLPAVLVLKATALALRDHPDLNGHWIDGAFRPVAGVHLGVAINLRRGGLLAPAIRHADERSLDDLMGALRDLVERTRSGGLLGSEIADATFTVSNLGDRGAESLQGLITPPQVGYLGVGRITPRPWAVDSTVVVRRTVYLGLAADHRASDGHRGGRFLSAIISHLTRPETL